MRDEPQYFVIDYKEARAGKDYEQYSNLREYKTLGEAQKEAISLAKNGRDARLFGREDERPQYLLASWKKRCYSSDDGWGSGGSWTERRHRLWQYRESELEQLVQRLRKESPMEGAELERITLARELEYWTAKNVIEALR